MTFPYVLVKWIPNSELTKRNAKVVEYVRPWITVQIFNPKNKTLSINAMCLLDTGSDTTFFNSEIGEALGYKIETGRPSQTFGVGGGNIMIYYHLVGVRVIDPVHKERPIEFHDTMGFTPNEFPLSQPHQTGILGTLGFIRNLNISFSYPKSITITPNNNLN